MVSSAEANHASTTFGRFGNPPRTYVTSSYMPVCVWRNCERHHFRRYRKEKAKTSRLLSLVLTIIENFAPENGKKAQRNLKAFIWLRAKRSKQKKPSLRREAGSGPFREREQRTFQFRCSPEGSGSASRCSVQLYTSGSHRSPRFSSTDNDRLPTRSAWRSVYSAAYRRDRSPP